MPRWVNEDTYNAEINSAAQLYGVPADLVRAIIGAESAFKPSALRGEVKLNDASVGLMQILLNTARGEGYTGDRGDPVKLTGLFTPAVNIRFGTSYLASQYRRTGGNIEATISAYNGGYRPELGFGAKATKPVRLCLARDAAGQCIQYRDVKVGEYGNQPYVNTVLGHYNYFRAKSPAPILTAPVPERHSPPLDNAHRIVSCESESENGGRVSRPITRPIWTQIWETVARWIQKWGA